MSGMEFRPATRQQARLRLALIGGPGTGKTYTALALATTFGPRVVVIDTERGSASKYAGSPFAFDTLELTQHHPQRFIDAIQCAANGGYDALVIDSLSHAWMGKGGALELVDQHAKQDRSGSTFSAWRHVTPLQTALLDAITGAPLHVIVTLRAKMEYVQEKDERGRSVIRKVGLAPVQRDGMEYEFDVVGDLDADHVLTISKSRCSELQGAVIPTPGAALAEQLRHWLNEGTPLMPPVSVPSAQPSHGANDAALCCEECAARLGEVRFDDGTCWRPAQLANMSRRRHGRTLCMTHYSQANAARRAAVLDSESDFLPTPSPAAVPAAQGGGQAAAPAAPTPQPRRKAASFADLVRERYWLTASELDALLGMPPAQFAEQWSHTQTTLLDAIGAYIDHGTAFPGMTEEWTRLHFWRVLGGEGVDESWVTERLGMSLDAYTMHTECGYRRAYYRIVANARGQVPIPDVPPLLAAAIEAEHTGADWWTPETHEASARKPQAQED